MENFLSCTPDSYFGNETTFAEHFKDAKCWQQIPLINYTDLHELTDLSLVRFRGMIQDMLDSELYLEKYEVKSDINGETRLQNGKYRDCLVIRSEESVNHDAKINIQGERRTIFIVSIPGLNDWAIDFEKNANNKIEKMSKDKIDISSGQKRSINDDDYEMEIDPLPNYQDTTKKKKIKNDNIAAEKTNSILSSEFLLNSPITERPSKACIVKIYDDFDKHLLNNVVDIIGFLSVDPILDGTNEESEFYDATEIQAANPPPSLIPRLHAIAIRKLEHLNPLLDHHISDTMINIKNNLNFDLIYSDIKNTLTQCLFGDSVAADYLLSHLISSVYVRTDIENLGQFSLNLCNIPIGNITPDYAKSLYEIIELITPASHYFPMTLENMNTQKFVPQKDYETNKLVSGLLQLAPHTHLVLDETKLQSGKLESNGILAVQNIAHLITTQQVRYNFKFYELNFNTDIPVLILSEGRSMLPSNIQLPIKVEPGSVNVINETLIAGKHFLQSKLNDIRMYLTMCKIQEFSLNPSDEGMIEKDFVGMRKENSKISGDSLHIMLVFSRLLGISKGRTFLDKECWQKAKELELQRLRRLEDMPKKADGK